MNDDKLKLLLVALKEVAVLIISAIEDYLATPYDRSLLVKRREKAR